MKTAIKVEYPTVEDVVVLSEAEAIEMGYKHGVVKHVPVNRPQYIQVKQVKRLVQEEFMTTEDYAAEMIAKCVAQTGMTPAVYQARFKRAWNE